MTYSFKTFVFNSNGSLYPVVELVFPVLGLLMSFSVDDMLLLHTSDTISLNRFYVITLCTCSLFLHAFSK